jgi:putative endonuclease
MPHYVYMILCQDGTFYTGYTKNLDSRMKLHARGKGARYTRMHRPKKVVYVEECSSIQEAMRREKKVKRLNHYQKLELTCSNQTKSKQPRKKSSKENRPWTV